MRPVRLKPDDTERAREREVLATAGGAAAVPAGPQRPPGRCGPRGRAACGEVTWEHCRAGPSSGRTALAMQLLSVLPQVGAQCLP